MSNARYIGRVGGLAVVLGVGVAIATTPGVALADPDGAGSSSSSDNSSPPGSLPDSAPSAGSSLSKSPAGFSADLPSQTEMFDGPRRGIVQQRPGGSALKTESVGEDPRSGIPAVSEAADTTGPVPVAVAVAKPTMSQASVAAEGQGASPGKPARPRNIPTGVSSTGANARSAAVRAAESRPQTAQATGTPAGDAPDQQTAQQPAATTVSGSSVPQTRSVVPQATPVAATAQMTAPTTTTSPVLSVVADALAWAGLSTSLTDSPVAPVESPAMLAVLAGWRRQSQQALAGEKPTNVADHPQTSQTVDPMVTGDLTAAGDQGDRQALADTSTMQLSAPVTLDVASAATPAPSAFAQVKAARQTKPDTTAPTVSFTAPANVSGTVTLSATASDNVAVAGVTFLLDGTLLADITSNPYSVSWNTTTATNGAHTLKAVARDAAGNTTEKSVSVTVANADTTLPVTITAIDIRWPADGHPLYPTAVAISGNRAYVYGGDVITVINTTTNTVIESTALYNDPPAISPVGDRKYVANGNSVDVVDTTTNTVIKNIEIPICYTCMNYSPFNVDDVVVSRDGTRAYVSQDYYGDFNEPTTVVSVIDTDPESHTYNQVIGSPAEVPILNDMEITPDGTIYGAKGYAYPYTAYLQVFNANMDGVADVPLTALDLTDGAEVLTLAMSPDGTRAYAVVYSETRLWSDSVIDTDPNSPTYNTEIAMITERDTALSPDGSRRYVAQPDGKTVVVFDTATNTAIGSFTTDQNSGASIRSIAVAPNGTLYITDAGDNKVYAVTVGNPTML